MQEEYQKKRNFLLEWSKEKQINKWQFYLRKENEFIFILNKLFMQVYIFVNKIIIF